MVLIPAGEFWMGVPEEERFYSPWLVPNQRHKVHVHEFYIDKYEVTNGRYAKFLADQSADTRHILPVGKRSISPSEVIIPWLV